MWKLIFKDLYLQRKIFILLLPFLFLYLFIDASSIWIGIVFSCVLILQSFATDEKGTIHLLLNSLPYTRKEIVASKYIGALVFTFIVLTAIFIGNVLIHRQMPVWKELFLILAVVIAFFSIAFPFSYLFNSNFLVIGFAIMFAVYLVLLKYVPNINDQIRELVNMIVHAENLQTYIFAAVVLLLVYCASWFVSVNVYLKKQF